MNTPRSHLTTLLGLDPLEQRPTTRARFAVTSVGTFATTVQVIVWLLIGVFTSHLDGPWWLWTPCSALAINVTLAALDRTRTHWFTMSRNTKTTQESL